MQPVDRDDNPMWDWINESLNLRDLGQVDDIQLPHDDLFDDNHDAKLPEGLKALIGTGQQGFDNYLIKHYDMDMEKLVAAIATRRMLLPTDIRKFLSHSRNLNLKLGFYNLLNKMIQDF